MDTGETTAVVVMALTLSLLATLYPSWRAARLDPVEACATSEPDDERAASPVIFLHAVERRYQQGEPMLDILNGAKLAVWPGQSVALVAPSGAGKSTLLHIAGLLEHPDGGEVYIDGARDLDRCRMPSARASAAPISASSISRTICCRNSPRSKT